MKRFLFLDDSDFRHAKMRHICSGLGVHLIQVETVNQAILYLTKMPIFDCVFLDHDLDDVGLNETGMEVAEFIANHLNSTKSPRMVVIHSVNAPAAARMEQVLRDGNIPVKRVPFLVNGKAF